MTGLKIQLADYLISTSCASTFEGTLDQLGFRNLFENIGEYVESATLQIKVYKLYY